MAPALSVDSPLDSLKFVRYQEDPTPFRNNPKSKLVGPSPWAHTPKEGPSVLKNYKPLKHSGKLNGKYKFTEVTPCLGREFYEEARLTDILEDEELLRDLAITVSERGVVFFKNQYDLTVDQQKYLVDALARAAKKPSSSGLHIHPTSFTNSAIDSHTGKAIPEVHALDSGLLAEQFKGTSRSSGWDPAGGFHSDITFEPVPASYAALRLIKTPSSSADERELSQVHSGSVGGSGGDTIWASGYGLAEKVSPEFLSYLEKLTGEYSQPQFANVTAKQKVPFWSEERGAPENVGTELTATHPIVRTNPVTGWKSIFGIGHHFTKINEVSGQENDYVKRYLSDLLKSSPEIQLRYKWNKYDIAIWDNRSTYHTIIHDLRLPNGDILPRVGIRTLSLGERPFLDPNSKLRTEDLANAANETIKAGSSWNRD